MLCLLWCLVEVNSQTAFPYVDFIGLTPLPNHTYIDLTLVGESGPVRVRCRTDLDTCCSDIDGVHHGDWISPGSEESLPSSADASADIYQHQGTQRVILRRRNNASMPSGIYRCDIPTNAVHDDYDISVRESDYVGLYAHGDNHEKSPSTVVACYWVCIIIGMTVVIQHHSQRTIKRAQRRKTWNRGYSSPAVSHSQCGCDILHWLITLCN